MSRFCFVLLLSLALPYSTPVHAMENSPESAAQEMWKQSHDSLNQSAWETAGLAAVGILGACCCLKSIWNCLSDSKKPDLKGSSQPGRFKKEQ